MKEQGYDEIRFERPVETPNGSKNFRRIDVQGRNSETNEFQWIQVGKQNKDGTPVAREQKAMQEIFEVTGIKPLFWPYNK